VCLFDNTWLCELAVLVCGAIAARLAYARLDKPNRWILYCIAIVTIAATILVNRWVTRTIEIINASDGDLSFLVIQFSILSGSMSGNFPLAQGQSITDSYRALFPAENTSIGGCFADGTEITKHFSGRLDNVTIVIRQDGTILVLEH
jgi:hypothetical protein